MQFFKPENYFEVREALQKAGRSDLIGDGCDCLISARPPKEAIHRRRKDANRRFQGEFVHQIEGVAPSADGGPGKGKSKGPRKQSRHPSASGYRPDRKRLKRRKDS